MKTACPLIQNRLAHRCNKFPYTSFQQFVSRKCLRYTEVKWPGSSPLNFHKVAISSVYARREDDVSFALGGCRFPENEDESSSMSSRNQELASSFVLQAYYGVSGTKHMMDVTAKIRSLSSYDGSQFSLKLPPGTKSLLLGDPAYLKQKHLILLCQLDLAEPPRWLIYADHQRVRVSQSDPIGSISTIWRGLDGVGALRPTRCQALRAISLTGLRRKILGNFRTCGGRKMHSWVVQSSVSEAIVAESESGLLEGSKASQIPSPPVIHPTAVVHPNAVLLEGVEIGPFCTVSGGAVIGRNTRLLPNSHVFGDTEIGENCLLYTGAIVGADIPGKTVLGNNNKIGYYSVVGVQCQDLKYKQGSPCFLLIGQGNDIREHVSIHRSSKAEDTTELGDNNLVMGGCHVAHDCKIGHRNILANGTLLAGHVVLEECVHTGGATAVHQFCHIGAFAFLAGGSMVAKDVPAYSMVAGDRAELRGLNLEGLKRAGFSESQICGIRRVYRKLFLGSGLTSALEDRLSELEADEDARSDPVVFRLVESVRASLSEGRRGICNFQRHKEDQK